MPAREDDIVRVDARGLHCPLPVLRAKKALAKMAPGERLEVSATDQDSVRDFDAFTKKHGHRLIESTRSGEIFVFLIEKGG